MSPSLVMGMLALTAAAALGQPSFVDGSANAGFGDYVMSKGLGGGACSADYDGDGDIDIFVPTEEGTPDQLYRNTGFGQFEEIASEVGLDSYDAHRVGLWFDADADGLLDLIVLGDCNQHLPGCLDQSFFLFRQVAPSVFEEVTEGCGIVETEELHQYHRGGALAADFNNDGWLDLIFTFWHGPVRMFVNNGDFTFTDITESAGIDIIDHYWQPIAFDANDDGWMDFYLTVDTDDSYLWINNGDLTFTDMAVSAGVAEGWSSMGIAVCDYDNDADLDIYVTEITTGPHHNRLFRNDGNLDYTQVAQSQGVEDTSWGWGATFGDYDLDGWVDLAATNGFNSGDYIVDQSKLFWNTGDGFVDASSESGFDDTEWGNALMSIDVDRDGDLDLLQTLNPGPLRLLSNVSDRNGTWLTVRPRGYGANDRAIGAIVRVEAAGMTMTRLITAGTSFHGQEPAEAHFGLGPAGSADSVTVHWPGGGTTIIEDVAGGQILDVLWCTADYNEDGVLNILDFVAFQAGWTQQDPRADCDANGQYNILDFVCFQGEFAAGCP